MTWVRYTHPNPAFLACCMQKICNSLGIKASATLPPLSVSSFAHLPRHGELEIRELEDLHVQGDRCSFSFRLRNTGNYRWNGASLLTGRLTQDGGRILLRKMTHITLTYVHSLAACMFDDRLECVLGMWYAIKQVNNVREQFWNEMALKVFRLRKDKRGQQKCHYCQTYAWQ